LTAENIQLLIDSIHTVISRSILSYQNRLDINAMSFIHN
jgi:hypothetical protein